MTEGPFGLESAEAVFERPGVLEIEGHRFILNENWQAFMRLGR